MSRIAKRSIIVPSNIEIQLNQQLITIRFKKLELSQLIHEYVSITYSNNMISFNKKIKSNKAWEQVGTARSLVNSMIIGLTEGFQKKLNLLGVGYRMSLKNKNIISMTLGYSHIIEYFLPEGVSVEFPSNTEVILKGMNKQLVGQVAANIRSHRVPELYKGKGIRYENEVIKIKEAKKK